MTPPRVTPDTLAILKIPASVDLVAAFLLLLSKHHPDCVLVPSTPENAWLTIESAPTPSPCAQTLPAKPSSIL